MERFMMNEPQILSALIYFGCVSVMASEQNATTSPSASPAELKFDHVWIVVTRGCPGTSSVGKSGIKDFARRESSRRTRHSVDHC